MKVEILSGLKREMRSLPSKYFYDDYGSQLFSRIMDLPEYYPTRCEEEILRTRSHDMLACLGTSELVIVELGAGDGRKTRYLLEAARELGMRVVYRPIDISSEALRLLGRTFQDFTEHLRFDPVILDLEEGLRNLPLDVETPNLVLFLGSTIGNMRPRDQAAFLREMCSSMHENDYLLTGFDLKKYMGVVLPAYSDSAGITAEFNLNLLRRINRELNADFDLNLWRHAPVYNKHTASMESYLMSTTEQVVTVAGEVFQFAKGELIHTEDSWKFSKEETRMLASSSGFVVLAEFECSKNWFLDALWTKARDRAFS